MLCVETKPKLREKISSFLLINFNTLKLKLDIKTFYCIFPQSSSINKQIIHRIVQLTERDERGFISHVTI